MLAPSLKTGETIIDGDAVQLTVVAISNNKVRLGITVFFDVSVYRSELKVASHGRERSVF